MPKWINEIIKSPAQLIELFAILNFAFLTMDIFFAHSVNGFAHWIEWVPLYFSFISSIVLASTFFWRNKSKESLSHHYTGLLVGWLSIFIGITGMIYHLKSQFFQLLTIKSLVYTAPFIAPLAYTGLGFLLLLNRMVLQKSTDWGRWVLFLALGGFLGNFILALADHAQNGFFSTMEWVPVWSSAYAIGCLTAVLIAIDNRSFLKISAYVMIAQALIGVLGFYFHLKANLSGISQNMLENFTFGTPLFAPFLLPNLAALALIGIWNGLKKIDSQSL